MNITSPLFKGATEVAALPGDSLASLVHRVSDITGVFTDAPDGGLGFIMSGLAGAAAHARRRPARVPAAPAGRTEPHRPVQPLASRRPRRVSRCDRPARYQRP